MIVAAFIAAIYIHYDVKELTITGDIRAGLPPFQLPNFSLSYQSANQTVHKHFGDVLSVSMHFSFWWKFPIELTIWYVSHSDYGERGGSVIECRTPEREVVGWKPTAAVLCPWARHFTPRKYWLITQEAVAPSRHDWKIVDWDVKPQYKQNHSDYIIWPYLLTRHKLWISLIWKAFPLPPFNLPHKDKSC